MSACEPARLLACLDFLPIFSMSSLPPSSAALPLQDVTTDVLANKAKSLRRASGLTLQQLSQRSGIAPSTLSKIENGQLSPTYEKIVALAYGLSVDVGELFSPVQVPALHARRSVTRAGQGLVHSTEQYDYAFLHADLAKKRFIPLLTTIKARHTVPAASLSAHDGEEMVYVLSGSIQVHTAGYAPLVLEVGDSCYFDSTMAHALLSCGECDAQVLWISSHSSLDTSKA